MAVIFGPLGYIGGITGYNAGVIQECSSECSVSGPGNIGGITGASIYDEWIGGTLSIENCYSQSEIHGDSEIDISIIGGIAGECSEGEIKNCYSASTIITTNSELTHDIGGLIGYSNESYEVNVTNSFWDKEISNILESAVIDPSFGKTTAEMKQQSTFTNWNFTDIWEIVEGVSYPTLKSIPEL